MLTKYLYCMFIQPCYTLANVLFCLFFTCSRGGTCSATLSMCSVCSAASPSPGHQEPAVQTQQQLPCLPLHPLLVSDTQPQVWLEIALPAGSLKSTLEKSLKFPFRLRDMRHLCWLLSQVRISGLRSCLGC